MNINDSFPSKYIKASDLNNKALLLKIARVDEEEVGEDIKPVIYFQGGKKGLVLNKVNSMMIADRHGPETDGWVDAEIELYPDVTNFQGKMVDCLRVRHPIPPAAQSNSEEGEEIPF